ncbi:MAG: serine/threonine protein kinase [Anaerolineales bacterium]|nr:serine/threonine protein kinase [Anaerolineales bacterium]
MTTTTSLVEFQFPSRWLWLARLLWVMLLVMCVGILLVGARGLYTGWYPWSLSCSLRPPHEQAACLAMQQALHHLGLPLIFPALYFSVGAMIEVLPWILVGLLIFSKKSHQPFEFFFALMLVVSGTITLDTSLSNVVWRAYPAFLPLFKVLGFLGSVLLILWYRFPDGRFVLPQMQWVAMLWVVVMMGSWLRDNTSLDFYTWPDPLPSIIVVGFAASLVFTAFYRYRRMANPAQRQQIKWVLASGSVLAAVYSAGYVLPYLFPTGPELSAPQALWWLENIPRYSPQILGWLIYTSLYYVACLMVAVSIAFSVLRYRLWDIDFFINRSLVYGALTAVLLVFFGLSLFVISQLFQDFAGGAVLAVAISAAGFGAIFHPTRRRFQRFVDQRFYHIQIDYQKTPISGLQNLIQMLRPTHFGPYRQLEPIGRGGMAEVYKTTHPRLNRPVALKILPAPLAAQADFRQRFTREAHIVATLEHPNIIRVFDYGEHEAMPYMVMEYVNGQDLGAFLRTHGKLSLASALPLIRQIADALDYAHAHGLVHRDIKPSNILLDSASHPVGDSASPSLPVAIGDSASPSLPVAVGDSASPSLPVAVGDTTGQTRVVLTDFGIAKVLDARTAITRTGGVLGTFDYIAPEQIEASPHVDGRADVYALGVMVYQMLTGELPFKHHNPGALLIAHMTQPPPDPRRLAPDLSRDVAHALKRAMAKNPDERFATAGAFVTALS